VLDASLPDASLLTDTRVRVHVRGTVQGVGFRPYVYRLAGEMGLAGVVYNDDAGAAIEVEGNREDVATFLDRLPREAPALARIDQVRVVAVPVTGEPGFRIRASEAARRESTPITPDAATCAACLAELFDPTDRRYRYPFINCTDCGPRLTIVVDTPYDRASTSMAKFRLCTPCRREYEDPASRRFHAQPNACPDCGPRVRLLRTRTCPTFDPAVACVEAARRTESLESGEAVREAVRLLCAGAIVAVKGIGGYHLACRADDERAVASLRARKRRAEKPFALMVRDLDCAGRLIEMSGEAEALLLSCARPIVLATRLPDVAVAPSVAPGTPELGVMLPYTPLHHLLLADTGLTLVMTSGNGSDEPIACEDGDALSRLGGIADAILTHDRPIHIRADDSVARAVRLSGGSSATLMIRRSRGHVPDMIPLPLDAPPLLAVGAEQKNTFCLAHRERSWPSHHIGDLENWETLDSFRTGIAHFERLFRIRPECIAHDLHPEYLSTKYALDRELPAVGVQHHHAHLAACLAEHGITDRAIGVIYDGTGYGTDGTIWGGELLLGDLAGFQRIGRLRAVRLPGGAAAIREPWRMAWAWLIELGLEARMPPELRAGVPAQRRQAIARLIRSALNSPITTSAGRLFDAVAALCGVRTVVSYEGQAAIELEARAEPRAHDGCEFLVRVNDLIELDPAPAIERILDDRSAGEPVSAIAARFHTGFAKSTVLACTIAAEQTGIRRVVLSGGVFQNVLLLRQVHAGLAHAGLDVLLPARVPANDGGIAYGQAAVAAARMGRAGGSLA
jgi:hydrogenase maturation protein HypF